MKSHGEGEQYRTGHRTQGVLLILMVLLAVSAVLTGCGQSRREANPGEGRYNIYYLDKNVTSLSPIVYEAKQTETRALVSELMEQLLQVPNDADVVPAVGGKVRFESFSLDGDVLYLYFNERYAELKSERKALCNAALTNTLSQIQGVRYVGIYSGGQPLVGEKGTPLGPFGGNDFVSGVSDVNSYESIDLTLYFADAEGAGLKKEIRTLTYRVDMPVEQLIVEQLIAGPQSPDHTAIVSNATKLLSISVNESICYLNFSKEFLDAVPIEDPNLTIYAIVNSLSELQTVQRVQIAVEGAQNVQFRDAVSLDTLFERNLDYME